MSESVGFKDKRNMVAGSDTDVAKTQVLGLTLSGFDKRGEQKPEITDTRGYIGRHRRR